MKQTLQVQIGAEAFDSAGKRLVRLTPVDRKLDVSSELGQILLLVAGIADANDSQPGDGEIDVSLARLTPSVTKLLDQLGATAALRLVTEGLAATVKGAKPNAFIRLRLV